jgi:hypothetical protein
MAQVTTQQRARAIAIVSGKKFWSDWDGSSIESGQRIGFGQEIEKSTSSSSISGS